MRRIVAFALVHALVASTAMGASLHVHEYAGHDHPDHRHGPASHGHHQDDHSVLAEHDHDSSAEDAHDPEFQAAACDPARHAIAVTIRGAHAAQVHVDVADLPGPTISAPAAPVRSASPVTDVRVHGPPFDARVPARAPPLKPHA